MLYFISYEYLETYRSGHNGADSKSVSQLTLARGFESLRLRQTRKLGLVPGLFAFNGNRKGFEEKSLREALSRRLASYRRWQRRGRSHAKPAQIFDLAAGYGSPPKTENPLSRVFLFFGYIDVRDSNPNQSTSISWSFSITNGGAVG